MTRIRTALALLFCSACHAYAPASPAAVSPGDQVRALLTTEQFAAFADALPTDDRRIEGTVIQAGHGTLLLEVPVFTEAEGMRVESLSQRLQVQEVGLADLEVRTLSRSRTFAVLGAVAALAGYVAWEQIFSDSDRGSGLPDGPITELWRVVFRIPS